MATAINNAMLPNYTKKVKAGAKNGFGAMFSDAKSPEDLQMEGLKANPALQEQYKLNNPGSAVNVGGQPVWPWQQGGGQIAAKVSGGSAGRGNVGPQTPTTIDPYYRGGYRGMPTPVPAPVAAPAPALPGFTVPKPNVIGTTLGGDTITGGASITDPVNQPAINNARSALGLDVTSELPSNTGGDEMFDANGKRILPGEKVSLGSNIPTETLPPPSNVVKTTTTYDADGNVIDPNAIPGAVIDPRAEALNQRYYDELNQGLDGEGFAGTQAATSAQREALAAFAKDSQAKAGLATANKGAIGQGTQAGNQQGVQQNIMQQLGKTENEIAQARRADYEKSLAAADKKFTGERNFAEGVRTFDENLKVQKEQLAHTIGESNLKALEALGQDNPELHALVVKARMGKEGLSFTPEQEASLKAYYKKKADRQEVLDKGEEALMAAMPKLLGDQIKSMLEPGQTKDTVIKNVESALKNKDASKLLPSDYDNMTKDDQDKLVGAGIIPKVEKTYQSKSADAGLYTQMEKGTVKVGDVIEKGGQLYRLASGNQREGGDRPGVGTGNKRVQQVWATPIKGGEPVLIWESDGYGKWPSSGLPGGGAIIGGAIGGTVGAGIGAVIDQ